MNVTKVLIVDDSLFFRLRLAEILDADKHIEVIGTASNGLEAIRLVDRLKPDVVTMDIEMPVMDGITAVKEIMKICPTPILMLSSITTAGARATLDALDAGAVDYLPKSISDISMDREAAKRQLCARVRVVNSRNFNRTKSVYNVDRTKNKTEKMSAIGEVIGCMEDYDLILIGTSTGGPAALQTILSNIPSKFNVPIVIVQHMPESFTGPFSERLNKLCSINVSLAKDSDKLERGCVYIAPGGHQLSFDKRKSGVIRISRAADDETYKPCIDVTFKSAASSFAGKVMAIVLTGMGSDGKEGVYELKKKGAKIIAQDKESCVVYGMPMAIVKEGLDDVQLSLNEISIMIASH